MSNTRVSERLEAAESLGHLVGLDHALTLASRGWRVVPYLDRPDHSQVSGWQNAATNDPALIEEWFGPGAEFEGCYVAVVPGLVDRTCIDLDDHGADTPNGFETAKALKLPVRAQTEGVSRSGKGKHLWYAGTRQSKRIYEGIDAKSRAGLVRVVYELPDVEDVYESLPKVYRINDGGSTSREYSGTAVAWQAEHAGKTRTPGVQGALDKIKLPFTGHDAGRDWLAHVVRLAGEGEGGVPEAIEDAYTLWTAATHTSADPETEWKQLLGSAIVLYGGEAPAPTEDDHPDSFFERGLLTARVSKVVGQGLAVAEDGTIWEYTGGVYRPADDVIEARMGRLLQDRYKRNQVETVRSFIIHAMDTPRLPHIPAEGVLNLQNGMLDWRTGVLEDHAPKHLSTLQLPLVFDPVAECPNFDAWLDEVVPTDTQPLVWEAIGYTLLSGNPLQVAMLLFGREGTGKSTFLRLIEEAMLGRSNVSHVTLRDLSQGKFEVARIAGKTANIVGDIDSKYLDDSARFKQITGQDTVMAQHKYGQPFDFTAWAVPVFSANKMWRSGDTTESYFRRWIILPFPNRVMGSKTFDERAMLHSESSGILNKAIAALRVLMARGKFEMVGAAAEKYEEFKRESDPIRKWLHEDERVTYDAGNDSLRSRTADVWAAYQIWAEPKMGKQEFYSKLRALGYVDKQNSKGQMEFRGIYVQPLGYAALSESFNF